VLNGALKSTLLLVGPRVSIRLTPLVLAVMAVHNLLGRHARR
jgi:hypothetical protein